MMIRRTGRAPGMNIRAYVALGLTVMALLFTASFFYFMSMAREVSVSGTRTYGLFMTLAESDKLTDSRNMARLRGAESALAALPSLAEKQAEPEARAALAELLRADPTWNQGTALALLVFVMLYAPCFVTLVVIRQESGSWKWVAFSIAFNTLLAFGMAVGVYQTYRFFWMDA